MKTILLSGALAIATLGTAAATAGAPAMLYEEQLAHQQEAMIIQSPIAGIKNHYWFDYQINVIEAKKELSSDLGRATDTEDVRDAWDEYAHELGHERNTYVKKMAKKGYLYGTVTIDG